MHTYESLKHTTWECKSHVGFISKCRGKALYAQFATGFGGAEGVQSGGGAPDARRRAHAVEGAAEVIGIERDGFHQWEKRDPPCPGVCWSAKECYGTKLRDGGFKLTRGGFPVS